MSRIATAFGIFFALCLGTAHAEGNGCSPDLAWRQVRTAYPLHMQTIAMCQNAPTSEFVVIVTEPAPNITRSKAEAIMRSLFASQLKSVQIRRHSLGFDGWADDLVISVLARTPLEIGVLSDDLALLAALNFGSVYKAEVEDISKLAAAPLWQAPPALEIKAEETHEWLLGASAPRLIPIEGGAPKKLKEIADERATGVFVTETPGLAVAVLPSGSSSPLNAHADKIRKFAVETDAVFGAIRLAQDRVAIVGRERTSSLAAMPPLRLETIILLASLKSSHLAQSYERQRAFAGKLLVDAGELFGWDWAPILLSDSLNDTELGSLLNFTDNMLKGWSESGKIHYKGFPHAYPANYPFGPSGAMRSIGTNRLTYNWNTAGVGYSTRIGGVDVFAVRNTGSLPVSYFPEGLQSEAKAQIVKAEDDAYRYFSSLRSPMLARAVQYAALYQIFRAFDMRATPPHDPASRQASIATVESVLTAQAAAALERLASPATPVTKHDLLYQAYAQVGEEGRSWQQRVPAAYEASVRSFEAKVQQHRDEISSRVRSLDAASPGWRTKFAEAIATGYPLPSDLAGRVSEIRETGFPLTRPLEEVRKLVVSATNRTPESWIKTPSIVVSRGDVRNTEGGHNIGGQATRVVADSSVPKGSVSVGGSYSSGRVIRLHPEDMPLQRDVVRIFDREVGLSDANMAAGKAAVERRMRDLPAAPVSVRPISAVGPRPAGEVAGRGLAANRNSYAVGSKLLAANDNAARYLGEVYAREGAEVIVARMEGGTFAIRHMGPPTEIKIAANYSSLSSELSSLSRTSTQGTVIHFHNMTKLEVERFAASVEARAKAVGGAGGKPPGGGSGSRLFGDFPEPGRAWWDFRSAKAGEGLGRGKSTIEVVKGDQRVLKTELDWRNPEIRELESHVTAIGDTPSFPGSPMIIEVRVNALQLTAKPPRLRMRIVSWFKQQRGAETSPRILADIRAAVKPGEVLRADEAAARFKNILKDVYKADDTLMHIDLESGGTVTVVEADGPIDARRDG